ncbi:MAG: hypothetical protein AB1331_01160 [Bacillota bacterium]
MGAPVRIVQLLGVAIFQSGKLIARLAPSLLGLTMGRRQAVAGFRRALKEAGLPPELIEALAKEYPRFDMMKNI